ARSFMKRFDDFRATYTSRSEQAPRVKIAVLDTGLNPDDINIRALRRSIERCNRSGENISYKNPIRETRNFTGDSNTDAEGHGTRVVGILLRIAPEADIYVAKISHEMTSDAFKWAIDDVKADIVSMSFGFDTDPIWKDEMDQAIRLSNKLFFAAASNYGANKRRTYPAKASTVFCIHATDGNGNKSGMDPVPLPDSINFTTLGVAVPCGYKDGNERFLCGSSYSTPIAVGIAANILDQAQVLQRDGVLDVNECNRLYGYGGMKSVFKLMACKTDGYDYLAPWNLWHEQANADTVWANIQQAL
ncbi:peptidase S8/S53 domain-containing protein, partial [Fusarium oxysporum]